MTDTAAIREKVKSIVAAILAMPSVPDDASAATLENWDSLAQIKIVLAIEGECNVTFADEAIHQLSSVQELTQYLAGADGAKVR